MEINEIDTYLKEGARVRLNIDKDSVYNLGNMIYESMQKGGKLLVMGNGGSAADAQHIAAEFVGKFFAERRALPAIALHTNTSSLTAIANDYTYDEVFSRQIEAFARSGDVVIGISTSGNSKNVLKAIEKANALGCLTVALTGKSGGKLKDLARITIRADSDSTPIIQEAHITIGHIISKIVEDRVIKEGK
ncbi:MAG: D-sedoheptulose-7-phosphate isomerase [Candidatus Micrarchaeia archaeon]